MTSAWKAIRVFSGKMRTGPSCRIMATTASKSVLISGGLPLK